MRVIWIIVVVMLLFPTSVTGDGTHAYFTADVQVAAHASSTTRASNTAHSNTTAGQHLTISYSDQRITIECRFPKPVMRKIGEYDRIIMGNLSNAAAPGEPLLPLKTLNILIPYGKNVESIEVHVEEARIGGRYRIELAPEPVPVCAADAPRPPMICNLLGNNSSAPRKYYESGGIQMFRGYKILPIFLHPVQYAPDTGEIRYFPRMTVVVNLSDACALSANFRGLPRDVARVREIVDNPEIASTYGACDVNQNHTSTTAEYVIITRDALKDAFQPLADWKESGGVSATIVTVEHIDSNYDGTDLPEKIRNFIIHAYRDWNTEYVLIGGDVDIVPMRRLYVSVDPYYIPSDLYYACLDGSWDNDGDRIYGEKGEEDWYAEVYVGRAPVSTSGEASAFVTKTIAYEDGVPDDYLKRALMLGAKLDANTDGGATKDIIAEMMPDDWSIVKLYERDRTASASETTAQLNAGKHIVNNIGHAYSNVVGLACVDYEEYYAISDVIKLENAPRYFLFYTIGCYANAIDMGDCIGEHFVKHEDGAFAFIGNTRYGWYAPGYLTYYSLHFDIEFFDAIFCEHIRCVGEALQDSKEDLIPFASCSDHYRYIYYELTLLGDPETYIAAPSSVHVERITLPDDDAAEDGVQITPHPGGNRTVHISAAVRHDDGWAHIEHVSAHITGPSVDDDVMLSIAWHDDKTAIFNGSFNMSFSYQKGTYTVTVIATDDSGSSESNSTDFTYLPLSALEIDADHISFGIAHPGENITISGDHDMETPEKPTIANIGNVPIDVSVSCDDNAMMSAWMDVMINGCGYLNLSETRRFNVSLDVGDSGYVNFRLNVPFGMPAGVYALNISLRAMPSHV